MAPATSSKHASTDGPPTGRSLAAGAVAGLVAGVVMSLYMTTLNLTLGSNGWTGTKLPGFPILGHRALLPGFNAVAVTTGIVCHLAVSAAWGAAFGFLAYARSTATTIVAGLAWGVVCWLVMFRIVLPALGLGPFAAALPYPGAIVEHLIFGLALALALLAMQSTKRTALKPRIDSRTRPRARAS